VIDKVKPATTAIAMIMMDIYRTEKQIAMPIDGWIDWWVMDSYWRNDTKGLALEIGVENGRRMRIIEGEASLYDLDCSLCCI
jgi:hypothetical protein